MIFYIHVLLLTQKHGAKSAKSLLPDTVENVDEDKEQCDQQCHSSWNNLRLDEEGHPGNHHKHAAGQIDLGKERFCFRIPFYHWIFAFLPAQDTALFYARAGSGTRKPHSYLK